MAAEKIPESGHLAQADSRLSEIRHLWSLFSVGIGHEKLHMVPLARVMHRLLVMTVGRMPARKMAVKSMGSQEIGASHP